MAGQRRSVLDELEDDLLSGKPVADALRRCVILGGRVGSTALRDWASHELKGYANEDDVPDYRTVGAVLQVDAVLGNTHVQRQRISPLELPEFAHEHIDETYTFRDGIGGIEALIANASKSTVQLSVPRAADLGRMMDSKSGNPYQHIYNIYWSVSVSTLAGIVDQVKSKLAELIGEMRAGTPANVDLPDRAAADQAYNVAIHGAKRVVLNTAQASGGSTSTVTAGPPPESGFWTTGKKIGSAVVGASTIIVCVLTWLMFIR